MFRFVWSGATMENYQQSGKDETEYKTYDEAYRAACKWQDDGHQAFAFLIEDLATGEAG